MCFNEGMWIHACVSIASLLDNSRRKCSYCFHLVISPDMPNHVKENILKIAQHYDPVSSIEFLEPNSDLDGTKTGWRSITTFYRFALIELLKLDKVIYADVDILFTRDLTELDAVELGDNYLAGVEDIGARGNYGKRIGYVNAGVLVMNLKKLREVYPELIKESCIEYEYADQDILNKVCRGRILELDWMYNLIPYYMDEFVRLATFFFQTDYFEIEEKFIERGCAIVHFALGLKPWALEPGRNPPLFAGRWERYKKTVMEIAGK